MKNSRIAIIHRTQFGYHTDIFKWCEFLHDTYHIDLICFNEEKPKYTMENVDVHYCYGSGGKIMRWVCFIMLCFIKLSLYKGIIVVSHFKYSYLLKRIMPWRKMVLDIRTFSVSPNEEERRRENEKLFKSVTMYDYVTVISDGLRRQLPKSSNDTAVIPLGGDVITLPKKDFSALNLLYVGTFFNRRLEDTIRGFAKACSILPSEEFRYHIVGSGNNGEDDSLKRLATELGIEDKVFFWGKQPHDQLEKFYLMCNVGVSYVPITPYYAYQPVTKSFEYIMAGLYTIATATESNKEIITSTNGCLIEDNANSFCEAVLNIANNRLQINDSDVRNSLIEYSWYSIVNNRMKPVLNAVYNRFYD